MMNLEREGTWKHGIVYIVCLIILILFTIPQVRADDVPFPELDIIYGAGVDPDIDIPYIVINKSLFMIRQICDPDIHVDEEIWNHIVMWEPDAYGTYDINNPSTKSTQCTCWQLQLDGTAICYQDEKETTQIEGPLIIR